jgi:hypothetical protein
MSKERKERVSKITSQFKSDLKRAVSHKNSACIARMAMG